MQSQEYPSQYYMVLDEKSTGPFTLDEVILHPGLTKETLIWKPGIPNWVAAETLPELQPAFVNSAPEESRRTPPEEPPGYSSSYQQPPYQGQHFRPNYYERRREYNDPYRPAFRTNWLPWAIVATVVGFFTSCIGAIFGIIGIVQANKANNLYAQGYDREADAANSNAKIMTIIGLIFAGIGIIALFWFGSFFNSLANLSYL